MSLQELIKSILEGKEIELRTGEGVSGWVLLEYPKSFTILQLEEFLSYNSLRIKK